MKKYMPLLTVLSVMLIGLFTPAQADIGELYFAQPVVTAPADVVRNHPRGRVLGAHHTVGKFEVWPRHFGWDAVSEPYPWPAGHLTGLDIPYQPELHQLTDDPADPCQIVQVYENTVGFYINSDKCPNIPITGGGRNIAIQHIWDLTKTTAPKPFTDPTMSLVIQWHGALQTHNRVAPGVYQFSMAVILADNDNNLLYLLVNVTDSRHLSYPEFIAHDTYTVFSSSPLLDGQKYVTKSPYGSGTTNTANGVEKFYRAHFTRANVLAAVSAANVQGGGFDTNIEDYRLATVVLAPELALVDPGQGSIEVGGYVKGLLALTCTAATLQC